MNTKHGIFALVLTLFITSIILVACGEGDPTAPPVDHDHDPATTVIIECVKLDASGNPTSVRTTALVRDTTVVKGKPREEGMLQLESGASYAASIELLDESKTPAVDVTHEIEHEKDSHLFILTPVRGVDNTRIVIADKDKDSKGFDVGLTFKLTVTAGPAVTGALNMLLRHYDSGNKNDAVFDTDINIDVPLKID